MTADPLLLSAELDRATQRLLENVAALDEPMVAGPSRLPGWTRGHVLAHLARNADSYVNLLTSARTGARIPQYPSRQVRDEQIEAGAPRPLAEQLADLRAAHQRFVEAMAAMPPAAWTANVQTSRGEQVAATVVWGRLREVEVHHVDLDLGYTPADWSEAFSQRLLHEVVSNLTGRVDTPDLLLRPDGTSHPLLLGASEDPPVVSGPTHALAGWLTGRCTGRQLTISPDGPLPTLPPWR